MTYQVPRLILQPILENAFEHGLNNIERNGLLKVWYEEKEKLLFIHVEDNGSGMTLEEMEQVRKNFEKTADSVENGLCNINQRLKIRFGETCGILIERGMNGGTCCSLVLPAEKKEEEKRMLYRILVVDDEELITDSLAGMLAEAPQYELDVYKAYSGSEALELLNEQQFDIVVSDICMPGISGIGLAQKIREKWPLCHVIFQTGYDDFQYAQQAIRQRVTHYILKSEGDEVLLAAIGECIRRLEEDARKQADLIRVQEENRVYKAMIRRKQIQNLFRFDQEKEENFSIDLKKPVFLLAGRSSEKMEEAVGLAVDEVLKEKIAYAVRSEMAWLDKKVIIWILQQEEKEDLPYAAAVVKGMAEGFCHVLRYRFGIAFSFVFQEKEIEWSQVAEELERLRQIATNRLNPDKQLVMAGVEYFEDAEESEKSFVNRLMNYMWENIDGDLSLCTAFR